MMKKANDLIINHNIGSLDDLMKLHKKIKLPDQINKGIKYFNKIEYNIPRYEIDIIYLYLISIISKNDLNINLLICGSYRRLNKTSNDIDILIYNNSEKSSNFVLHTFIQLLIDNHFIVESFTSIKIKTKYMGLCRYNNTHPIRRIDIRYIPIESIATAILYFTGSKSFNQYMRSIALKLKYSLNEYQLLDNYGNNISIKNEKDIFDKLNIAYVPPHRRL